MTFGLLRVDLEAVMVSMRVPLSRRVCYNECIMRLMVYWESHLDLVRSDRFVLYCPQWLSLF